MVCECKWVLAEANRTCDGGSGGGGHREGFAHGLSTPFVCECMCT